MTTHSLFHRRILLHDWCEFNDIWDQVVLLRDVKAKLNVPLHKGLLYNYHVYKGYALYLSCMCCDLQSDEAVISLWKLEKNQCGISMIHLVVYAFLLWEMRVDFFIVCKLIKEICIFTAEVQGDMFQIELFREN